MKLISPSHEIWEQDTSGKPLHSSATSVETMRESLLHGIYAQIERAGRVCYKSEDKITNDSAKAFVNRLIESKHYAMLEHGTVYLTIPCADYNSSEDFMLSYGTNPYTQWDASECNWDTKEGYIYVTTNFRVIVENNWMEDLECISSPGPKHPRRITVKLITSRNIAMELLRHRHFSFAMESTRYCNYSRERFGGELQFILPCWLKENPNEPKLIEDPMYDRAIQRMKDALQMSEFAYMKLLKYGWKPQQAAVVLPNALKAEIVVTGFMDDWKYLFNLRVKGTTGAPHPQMIEVMKPVYDEFVKRYGIA